MMTKRSEATGAELEAGADPHPPLPVDKGSELMFRASGTTPVRHITVSSTPKIEIAIKLENTNPTGSHKDRLAHHVISQLLSVTPPVDELVDVSSGSYIRSFMYFAWAYGFRATVFYVGSPYEVSVREVESWKQTYNCQVIRSSSVASAIMEAQEYTAKNDRRWYVGQFDRVDCAQVLSATMGREIVAQVGKVSDVVASVGSGGLLYGSLRACVGARGHVPVFGCNADGTRCETDERVSLLHVDESAFRDAEDLCCACGIDAGLVTRVHVAGALRLVRQAAEKSMPLRVLTFATDRRLFE